MSRLIKINSPVLLFVQNEFSVPDVENLTKKKNNKKSNKFTLSNLENIEWKGLI